MKIQEEEKIPISHQIISQRIEKIKHQMKKKIERNEKIPLSHQMISQFLVKIHHQMEKIGEKYENSRKEKIS